MLIFVTYITLRHDILIEMIRPYDTGKVILVNVKAVKIDGVTGLIGAGCYPE
jgi:hypothetical protein